MTDSWSSVVRALLHEETGSALKIPVYQVEHPLDAGMRRSVGLPMGQRTDYRLTLEDCQCLHVRDFGDHYEAHLDSVDPACDTLSHLFRDAPGPTIAGGAAIGALVGGLLGRSKESALAGASIGAIISSIAVALSDTDDSTKAAED